MTTERTTEVRPAPEPAADVTESRLGPTIRRIASEHLIWPILLLLVIIGAFVPGFLTGGNLLNLLWGATPLGCMVLGLYFVMIAGKLDLSLESTFALAPTVGVLAMGAGLNPVLGILLTLLVGVVVGLFNGAVSVGLNVNPFLVTLATLLTLRGVVVYLIPEGSTTCRRPTRHSGDGSSSAGCRSPSSRWPSCSPWPSSSCGTRPSAAA